MENYEIELITDEMLKYEQYDLLEMCSPGWCSPVDGFMLVGTENDD